MTCTMEPLHPLPSSSRWSHFPVRMSSVKARRQRKEPRPVERAASLQETVDNLARVPLLPPDAGGAASPGTGVPPPEPFWLRCGACKRFCGRARATLCRAAETRSAMTTPADKAVAQSVPSGEAQRAGSM